MDQEKKKIASSEVDANEKKLSDREEYERLRAQSKKLKKRMLAVFAVLLAAILLLFGIVTILDSLSEPQSSQRDYNYRFEPTYQGDIMENAEYLGQNRVVHYCENPDGNGLKQGITEELKAKDQMTWVAAMNGIKHSAEEIVLREFVCSMEVRK